MSQPVTQDDLFKILDRIDRRFDRIERALNVDSKKLLALLGIHGVSGAYYNSHGGAGQVKITRGPGAAGGDLELNYTPLIPCFIELQLSVGPIQKNDAIWDYMQGSIQNTTGAIPALTTGPFLHPGFAAGNVLATEIVSCHNALPFCQLSPSCIVPLTAGVAYSFETFLGASAGNWSYYQGNQQLQLSGKVWAR